MKDASYAHVLGLRRVAQRAEFRSLGSPDAYPSCQYLRESSCTQLHSMLYRTLWLSSKSHQLLLVKNILSDLVEESQTRRHRRTRR